MDNSYEICKQMFEQRNYQIIEEYQTYIIALKQNQQKIIVFFSNDLKINVKNIHSYLSIAFNLEIKHIIIIYKTDVTSFTKKIIEQTDDIIFELFDYKDLQFNITKHILQPTFQKLDRETANDFKKKFGTKFGIMKKEDPIAKFYFFQKGDVIRIIRKNNYITYRIIK